MARGPTVRRTAATGAALVLLTALTGLTGAAAQVSAQSEVPSKEELEAIDRQIEQTRSRSRALEEKARALAEELNTLRRDLVSLAKTTQEREALITSLEEQLQSLETERTRRRAVLTERHAQLSGTLGALARLSTHAPRAVFLYPGEPLEAVRGSMLLQAAVPALGDRAAVLREDLQALAAVQDTIDSKLARLSQEDAALADDRAHLRELIAKKKDLYESTAAESREADRRLRKLVAESKSLKDLVGRLEAERERQRVDDEARAAAEKALPTPAPPPEAAPQPPAEAPQSTQTRTAALGSALAKPAGLRAFPDDGRITAPVTGTVHQRYGEDTGFGHTAKGITVETRPRASIVSPYDGKAVFAGPFRDHGHVLIIEHDGGYHSVLAGFERIDIVPGQWVLAGEPVGTMPQSLEAGTLAAGGDSKGRPRLYMELRRNGQPINPLSWIAAGKLKVHG